MNADAILATGLLIAMAIGPMVIIFAIIFGSLYLVRHFRMHEVNPLATALGATPLTEHKTFGMIKVGNPIFTAELDGKPFQFLRVEGSKHQRAEFKVQILVPSSAKGGFVLRPERGGDRLFKRAGISVEVQTGDAIFDKTWYIDTESAEFAKQCFSSPEKRSAALSLHALGFNQIRLTAGTLAPEPGAVLESGLLSAGPAAVVIASIVQPAKGSYSDPEKIRKVVRELRKLSDSLPVVADERAALAAAKQKPLLDVVRVLPIILFVAAVFTWIWGFERYRPLDPWDLAVYSLGAGFLALILFLWFAIKVLKGRASSHTELLMSGMVTFLGIPLAVFVAMLVLNGVLDKSATTTHEARVLETQANKRKNSYTYYITVESWRPGARTEELRVEPGIYSRTVGMLESDPSLEVTTGRGRFGFEWVVKVEPKPGKTLPKAITSEPAAIQKPVYSSRPTVYLAEIPAGNSVSVQISAVGITAEVHGDDLRLQIEHVLLQRTSKAQGSSSQYHAIGAFVTRGDVGGEENVGCVWSRELNGTLTAESPTERRDNLVFVMPGGAKCAARRCRIRLLAAVTGPDNKPWGDYSEMVLLPISKSLSITPPEVPSATCWE